MNSVPPDTSLHLKKRENPKDYWEGYIAGLNAAREMVDRLLQIANAAELAEKPPPEEASNDQ